MIELAQGAWIGFTIAMPVGPIGLLCLSRSLKFGQRAGFFTGLGAASADAVYGLIGAMGVSALMNAAARAESWVSLAGGLFLLWIGVNTLREPERKVSDLKEERRSLVKMYAETFALTLTNPMTIIMFSALYASAGFGSGANPALFVFGVFSGSALWWLALSGMGSIARRGMNPQVLNVITKLSGIIICGVGGFALVRGVVKLAGQ